MLITYKLNMRITPPTRFPFQLYIAIPHTTQVARPPPSRDRNMARPRANNCSSLCFCCAASRLSTSISSSCSMEQQQPDSLSNLTHTIVQSRLQRMINESRGAAAAASCSNIAQPRQRRRRGGGSNFVVLVAVDRSSYDPRTDFRESIAAVISSKGMREPKELRTLLNCYMSLNAREHRQVILEAFYEVCTSLFVCDSS